MTDNQKAFADELIRTGNITQSYLNAYPNVKNANTAGVNGHNLLKNPKIKTYVDKRLELLKKQSIAEQDEVLQFYTSVLRAEELEEVVISSPLGVETVEKKPDISDRQRAGEELLKRYMLGNNQVLKDKLLEVQIQKLIKEMESDTNTEDRLAEYFSKLDGAFDE